MNTRNTVERVRGISWCAKIHYRTHTHTTRFGITVGLPAAVLNPNNNAYTLVTNIQWSLIVDMMSPHSGAQIAVDLNNMLGNVFAPYRFVYLLLAECIY